MNAAPAIFRNYVYVGNRTDGSVDDPHPGVLVVDVRDPSDPEVVAEIGPPNEGNVSETSRELRVWPQQRLLLVMNFQCSAILHECVSNADVTGSLEWSIKFYDLSGENAASPKLVATYVPSRVPHEMHLWVDPAKPNTRALLYLSTPTSRTDRPNLIVTDISKARKDVFSEIVHWRGNDEFTAEEREGRDVRLHSMGTSADGRRTYLAYLGGGFLVLDTSEVAAKVRDPEVRLLTPPSNSPRWPNQTVHSAFKFPGRDLAITTDEVYGDLLDPLVRPENEFGCPWGWVHIIDISDESRPTIVGRYLIDENRQEYCESADGQDPSNTFFTSYSAHNPTVLPNLAFVTWHSGGLQAFAVGPDGRTKPAGFFSPEPLPFVFTEDPALSLGRNKVVMWSFPIIKDGLIYAVDVRNGLYILRYTGPRAAEVAEIRFLEGNSNLGDALRLEGISSG
ncbi:MAG TPA: hypothetical protein VG709_00520 [Actinomycetota bacterium]|nr:hypothetical protein [Actinomycetota bacterium]